MKSDTGQWMPLYWADYFADTTHLTTEEHGAYLLLIGAYWRRNSPLPDDKSFLASLTKMTVRRFNSVRDKLSDMFVLVDGLWYHVRVEYELLRSSERLSSARANGRAGGLAKSYLPTPTPTKEEESKKGKILDFSRGRVGNGSITIQDQHERISRFQVWLSKKMGPDGWVTIGEAADPASPNYRTSLDRCKSIAREHGKGWPHAWPK
jgi:uncharacterized protein YdaU (DUF1376 family)